MTDTQTLILQAETAGAQDEINRLNGEVQDFNVMTTAMRDTMDKIHKEHFFLVTKTRAELKLLGMKLGVLREKKRELVETFFNVNADYYRLLLRKTLIEDKLAQIKVMTEENQEEVDMLVDELFEINRMLDATELKMIDEIKSLTSKIEEVEERWERTEDLVFRHYLLAARQIYGVGMSIVDFLESVGLEFMPNLARASLNFIFQIIDVFMAYFSMQMTIGNVVLASMGILQAWSTLARAVLAEAQAEQGQKMIRKSVDEIRKVEIQL